MVLEGTTSEAAEKFRLAPVWGRAQFVVSLQAGNNAALPNYQRRLRLACTCVGRQRVFLRTDDQQPQHDGEFGEERWLKHVNRTSLYAGARNSVTAKTTQQCFEHSQYPSQRAEPRARDQPAKRK